MVRYAEWREASRPQGLLGRADGLANFIGAFTFATVGFAVGCGIGVLPAFLVGWACTDKERVCRRLDRLRDVPTRHPQHACRITLEWCGVVYGRDEGLVSFVDGTLLFEGPRTTFSATRHRLKLSHRGEFRFTFGPTACHLTIFPFNKKEFGNAADEWLDTEPTEIDYEVLPPVYAQPEVERQTATLISAARNTGMTGISLALGIATFVHPFIVVGALLVTGFVAGTLAYTAVDERRIQRDLKAAILREPAVTAGPP